MRRRLPAALAAAAAAVTMAVPAATAATQARSSVYYAKPVRAQFINQSDSRARGNLTNPFNVDILPTPKNANSGKKGARAGDTARFVLTLYSDRKLTRPVGTASYSCTFNFAQEATCNADFEFGSGSMIAMGPARLDGSQIILPVIGGTGRYRGAHGQVTSTATGRTNTQLVRFELV